MFILRKNMVAGYWIRTLSNAYRAFWSRLQLVFQPVSSSGRSPFLPGTTNVLWLSSHYFHPGIHLHPAQFLALTAGGTEKETLWKQYIVGSYLGLSCFSIPSSQEALEQLAVPIRLSCPWALKNNSLLSIIPSFLFSPVLFISRLLTTRTHSHWVKNDKAPSGVKINSALCLTFSASMILKTICQNLLSYPSKSINLSKSANTCLWFFSGSCLGSGPDFS